MNSLLKSKTLVTVIVLAGFALLAFMLYSWTGGTAAPAANTDETEQVSQALLVTLASLHTIHLDGSVFSDPVFVSLTDFGVVIPKQNAGRRNPFLPVQ